MNTTETHFETLDVEPPNGVRIAKWKQAELAEGRLAPTTVRRYSFCLYSWAAHIEDRWDTATADDIRDWLDSISHLSPSTRSTALKAIRCFHRWEGTPCPADGIAGPKQPQQAPNPLPAGALEAMLQATDRSPGRLARRERILLLWLWATGARNSETCGMRLADIDWERGLALIRGKGRKERRVPIKRILPHLRVWTQHDLPKCGDNPDGLLFPTLQGRRMDDRHLRRVVASAAEQAGIQEQVWPHRIRATFATELHDAGASIYTISALLGHSSVKTTERYVGASQHAMNAAIDLLPDLPQPDKGQL